jgi:hypothetical protein
MRVVSIDQFEFDNPSSEESLEIAIAVRSPFPFPDASRFLEVRLGNAAAAKVPAPIPFQEHFGYGLVRKYTKHFTGAAVPEPCNWPTHVLADGPDEWNLVLCGPEHFIHYVWSTSA